MRYYVALFFFLWTLEEKKSSMWSSDFFFYKKKREAIITRSFSVLENLFEIIIRPEVFYKCMGNDELVFRAILIFIFLILQLEIF